MTTNCWRNCTTERKLAIIDGAIELGMSAQQVGENFRGVAASTVTAFALYHGRSLGWSGEERRKAAERARKMTEQKLRPIEPCNSPDAPLFPFKQSGNLFDPAPYDEEVFA